MNGNRGLSSGKGISRQFCEVRFKKNMNRDAIHRPLTNILSHKLILVLGCQRSGTTLTFMLLTSHPSITGKDEGEANFEFPTGRELLNNYLNRKFTCFKMPMATSSMGLIKRRFSHANIIYLIRHPYPVISSLRKLVLSEESESWLKACGPEKLKKHAVFLSKLAMNSKGMSYLRELVPEEIKWHAQYFPEIDSIDLKNIDEVTLAAYFWKYKNKMIEKFKEEGLKVSVIRYEDLVEDPRKTLEPVLKSIGIKFDDRMLSHHKVHAGKEYCGNAIVGRPIDKTRINPELQLDAEEMRIIDSICGAYASEYYADKWNNK